MLERNTEVEAKLRELAFLEQQLAEQTVDDTATRIRKAQTDFAAFIEFVMKDELTGEGVTLAPIHRTWIEHLTFCWSNGLHSCVLAPFGHGKTAIFSVALPLWLMGVDPSLRIKLYSANDETAKERVSLVRQYIDGSNEYHRVFPHVKPSETEQWTSHKLYIARDTMAKDATLQALGALSSGIGGRCDIMILDDLNDAKNCLHQPRLREQINRHYRAVYMSRLDRRHGLVAMIATRWHDKDLVGTILADNEARSSYGFLIQRIDQDMTAIQCEYLMGVGRERGIVTRLDQLLDQYERGYFDTGIDDPH